MISRRMASALRVNLCVQWRRALLRAWWVEVRGHGRRFSHVATVTRVMPHAGWGCANLVWTGGESGGWEAADHAIFERLMSKHRVAASVDDNEDKVMLLLRDTAAQVPEQNLGTARRHYEWAVKHKERLQRKRTLIARWREQKEKRRQAALGAKAKKAKRDEACRQPPQPSQR